jgi:uncharacterized repeat protein (TIGR03803 family)
MKKSLLTVALALACAAITLSLAVRAQAQTVTFLAKFGGTNGSQPWGSVVQATDGNFYGTTAFGGNGHGNVFRITPSGKVTSIYSFCPQTTCTDGAIPETAPILGSDGNLYGVTISGGNVSPTSFGGGVLYRLTLAGKITVLHNFCSKTNCTDGSLPRGIIQASDGNFYGATNYGGTAGVGTVFKVSPSGQLTVLHSSCSQANCDDGGWLDFPPIQGRDGNFYGVTNQGGTEGGGVFYKLTAAGNYQVLHNFCETGSCPDGSGPNAVVQDAQGNFFGTTRYGGSGSGTVFEFTSAGEYQVLHDLSLTGTMGLAFTALTLASDGNLYGTFGGGDPSNGGDAFLGGILEISPAGKVTTLHNFCGCGTPVSGYNPGASLLQGTDGNFYSTTLNGGMSKEDFGTVFKLSKGLSPLVETVPVAGKVGKQIIILGNHLTGTTGVTFNGVQANFTVKSDTYIQATVPAGASTGTVSVITPSRTLKSNPQFVVTK